MILFYLTKRGTLFIKEGDVSKGSTQQQTERELFFLEQDSLCQYCVLRGLVILLRLHEIEIEACV